jgi:hypothetical protein
VERTSIHATEFTAEHLTAIREAACALGLVGERPPVSAHYDAIAVLGGTLLACHFRTCYAKQLIHQGVSVSCVYLLGTKRPAAEVERTTLTEHGIPLPQSVQDEFAMLCYAAEREFGVSGHRDESTVAAEIGAGSFQRIYDPTDVRVFVLCTEGRLNPNRATTGDTYEHLVREANLDPGSRLLIVTTQIYAPFQHFDAVRLIQLPHNIQVETVGFPVTPQGMAKLPLHKPENFLQEIRSAILAASRLLDTLSDRV